MLVNALTDEELLAQIQNSFVGGRCLALELAKRFESLLDINIDQEVDLLHTNDEVGRLKATVEDLTADLDKANSDLEAARRKVEDLERRVDLLETRVGGE